MLTKINDLPAYVHTFYIAFGVLRQVTAARAVGQRTLRLLLAKLKLIWKYTKATFMYMNKSETQGKHCPELICVSFVSPSNSKIVFVSINSPHNASLSGMVIIYAKCLDSVHTAQLSCMYYSSY